MFCRGFAQADAAQPSNAAHAADLMLKRAITIDATTQLALLSTSF